MAENSDCHSNQNAGRYAGLEKADEEKDRFDTKKTMRDYDYQKYTLVENLNSANAKTLPITGNIAIQLFHFFLQRQNAFVLFSNFSPILRVKKHPSKEPLAKGFSDVQTAYLRLLDGDEIPRKIFAFPIIKRDETHKIYGNYKPLQENELHFSKISVSLNRNILFEEYSRDEEREGHFLFLF